MSGDTARSAAPVTRDLAVSVFVGWQARLLLHRHAKLGIWLPCGGHVEPNEIPDDAAVREVREEAGIDVTLVGERAITAPGPRQLIRPRGVQLEPIAPGHEHVDLIYYARPVEPYDGRLDGNEEGLGWYLEDEALALGLTAEMEAWVRMASSELR